MAVISSEEANKRSKDLFSYLGCNGSPDEMLKCAQNSESNRIADGFSDTRRKIFKNENEGYLSGTHFPVVINNDTFSESIGEIIVKKKFKKCKIITGFNSGEWAPTIHLVNKGQDPIKYNSTTFQNTISVVYNYYPKYPFLKPENFINDLTKKYQLSSDLESNYGYFKSLTKITSDFLFSCPTFEMAEVYQKSGLEAFVYLYDHRISSSIYPEYYGAVHVDEIPMLFAETLSNKKLPIISPSHWSSAIHNYSNTERKFNQDFLNYWLNFVKHDNPNYKLNEGLSEWKSFIDADKIKLDSTEHSQYLFLKQNSINMQTGFANYQCKFWNYTNNARKNSVLHSILLIYPFYYFLRILF
jgi:carboxylesterase type B